MSFRSCYTGEVGTAKIRQVSEGIHWETLSIPDIEDGLGYCATPGNATLYDPQRVAQYEIPARINEVDLSTSDFLMKLPDTDSNLVFTEAKVYHTPDLEDFQTILEAGKAVKILREAGEYVCQRIGDELFMAPIYEVSFEMYDQEMTGFMYHQDLALIHFYDNRENLFMLGMMPGDRMEPEDLAWTIIGERVSVGYVLTNLKALKYKAHGSFPAYDVHVESLDNAHYGFFTTLLVNWTIYGGNPGNASQLLIWDGQSLNTVLTQDQESLVREIQVTRERDSLILNYKRLLSFEQKEFDLMDTYLLSKDSLVNLTDDQIATALD